MSSSANGFTALNGHEVDNMPSRKRKIAGDNGSSTYTTTDSDISPKSAKYSLRLPSFSTANGVKEPLLPLATPSANTSLAVTPDGISTPSKHKHAAQNGTDGLLKRVEDYFSSLTSPPNGDFSASSNRASNPDLHIRKRSQTLPVLDDDEKSKRKSLNGSAQHALRPAGRLSEKLRTSPSPRSLTLPHSDSYNSDASSSLQGKLTSRRDSKHRWSRLAVRQLLQKYTIPALRLLILSFAIIGAFLRGTTRSRHIMRPPEYNSYQIPSSLGFDSADVITNVDMSTQVRLFDFDARANEPRTIASQHVLALLPIYVDEDADAGMAEHVRVLLQQLSNTDHPRGMISVGILLVGESGSTLRTQLEAALDDFTASATRQSTFRRVTLLKRASITSDTFDTTRYATGSAIHRARSLLAFSALQADVDWILWLDTRIKRLPSSIVQDLLHRQNIANSGADPADTVTLSYNGVAMSPRADVIVPNLIVQSHSGHIQPFDPQDWSAQSSSASVLAAAQIRPGGDVDSTRQSRPAAGVPLRSAKASVALVRAQTHLFGAAFPSWITAEDAAFGHTSPEAFGSVASSKAGANVVGLPDYFLEMHPD